MRQFRDEWRVYQSERNVLAEQRRDHLLPEEYRHGWLVFESRAEKRRLAPVPDGWADLPDEALATFCESATVQPSRPKGSDRAVSREVVSADEPETVEAESTLGSELKAVEARLAETLDQVCETPAVAKLDTGELIRVEETLSIAAEAAKEAVTLRRERSSKA